MVFNTREITIYSFSDYSELRRKRFTAQLPKKKHNTAAMNSQGGHSLNVALYCGPWAYVAMGKSEAIFLIRET
jgi:hypothetical protein